MFLFRSMSKLLLEQCWEPHTYVIKTGTQDKPGAKRVDLLRGAKDRWISVYWRPWRMFYLPSK
ncbi:unnamed protein product [Brassica rapa]|uniref:Uncharacterized protein n=2 Tax=Brassica TaxID=3705 RepID=A0A3P6A7E3_BRACM|nr:unnamed protein product [Brassica napus]CAG7884000.1 unnamed protein product [Brassica rapa]VDC83143.1 unnamed protein product [Brassica rapa]